MAQKRMFSKQITDTDHFMDMPISAQALYFHLGMNGDDDGFVSSPRKVLRAANCSEDDLRLLIGKGYIIPFESGVVVIVDWKINNYIKNDRYTPTLYQVERASLSINKNGRYVEASSMDTTCIHDGSDMDTQIRLDENSIEKKSIGTAKPPNPTKKKFSPPSLEEVTEYCRERGNNVDPQRFVDFYQANGWVQGKGKPIKDWKAAVRTWEANAGGGVAKDEFAGVI